MTPAAGQGDGGAPSHVPVLLQPLLTAVAPVRGVWLDGTLGAGGYAKGLLNAGAERVIGLDRDPTALEMAADLVKAFKDRLRLVHATFSQLDTMADEPLDGVTLDLGVSSMQIDQAARGFSFQKNGPLDMRMAQSGYSAEVLINDAPEPFLADILFHYGGERAARRIAKSIAQVRRAHRLQSTQELADLIAACLPRRKPGQIHPATRSFQAIRMAVNNEPHQLVQGLSAAERALKPGGKLAVVTFHSVEDRVVKRFLADRAGGGGGGSRHAPVVARPRTPTFHLTPKKAIVPDTGELARNPRARSAKLRVATRMDAPPRPIDMQTLGLPPVPLWPVLAGQI